MGYKSIVQNFCSRLRRSLATNTLKKIFVRAVGARILTILIYRHGLLLKTSINRG